MNAPKLVSVVLPTFNERGNIVSLVHEVLEALSGYAVEILVVDDNSPDGTASWVRENFPDRPDVKVIVRTINRGFAKSIRTGIEQATGDAIIVMDSDGNHKPCYLPFMIQGLSHYDCVMGSRFVYGGRMFPRSRHLLSWLFNVFVRCVTRGQITDNLYGYFAIHTSLVRNCPLEVIFEGYGEYFIRLLYHLQWMNLNILQFPAVNGERRAGKGNQRFWKTFWIYFAATWRLVFAQGRLQYVHSNSCMSNLQESAPGNHLGPGSAGTHGGLPTAGDASLRRSA
jgi:dolichol-phosphate mannosyltransferase